MPLYTSAEIYRHAHEGGYVVAGFDSYCLEVIQAHVRAANAEKAPFLLQVTPKGFRHIGVSYFAGIARAAIEESRVPVALHLDHGTTLEEIVSCIRNGFSSVMIDGSMLPFEDNLALTGKVVEIAHAAGVSVEAELGRVLGKESDVEVRAGEEAFTDPGAAGEFARETGVDALAVSVGNIHGFYRGEPRIDFRRLEAIHRQVPVPLVFHGGSGLGEEVIEKAGRLGVRKVNIGTAIKKAFTDGIRAFWAEHPEEFDPRRVLGPAREAVVEELRRTLRMFGASGRSPRGGRWQEEAAE
jgi:fructose-bisphosphate aldolase class II